ncbi:MAG: MATE family efflux transporter [Clostridiales bacterium]|nr:MATE family efflux transporter [Clostridiales bacterium]
MKNHPSIFKRRGAAALDLTVGSPLKRILLFMAPMLIGNVVQQLYSMVDTIIVGQTIGSDALAGVGSTGAMTFLILGFVSGLTHGFSVVVSQRRGAHDEEGMRRSFATGISLTLVIVSVLTVIALTVAEPLLVAMNTQPDFFPYAYEYLTVIFGGMLLSALSNQFASTLRAIGDSVVPLFVLIFSCVFNASFDCLFIISFDMGVSGAAAATVLSNGLSALLIFTYMWVKYPMLRFKPKHFRPNLKRYAAHLKLGVPMALQMSVISIGMIAGQTALNTMSPTQIKAYVAATKIDNLATSVLNTAGVATATFVGQNYGAKRYDRIKKGVKQYSLFMAGISIALGALVIALHRPLVMLFISRAERTDALYAGALKYLAFNAGFYILLATLCITRSGLQGMGRGTLALSAAMAEVVMRVGVAFIAMHFESFTIVCMLNCMSWLGANLMLFPAFLSVLRKYVPLFKPHAKFLHLPNPSEIPFTQINEE